MTDFFVRFSIFLQRERGQTMAEYVVVLGIISVTILAALTALKGGVTGALGKVTADL